MNGDYEPTVGKERKKERKGVTIYAYPAILLRSGGYFIKGPINRKLPNGIGKIYFDRCYYLYVKVQEECYMQRNQM